MAYTIQVFSTDGSATGKSIDYLMYHFIMKYIGQGIDYTSGPYSVQFNDGDVRASFNVSINNDNILEGNEVFNLIVNASSLPSTVSVGDPGQTTVTIVDNDGKCKAINALIYCKIVVMLFLNPRH